MYISQLQILYSACTDNAYACDPRIMKFKEEEKEKKAAQKKAKQDAARQKQEEEERVQTLHSSTVLPLAPPILT